jgi:chromosome segregation ATPase
MRASRRTFLDCCAIGMRLYHIARGDVSLGDLLRDAPMESGLYADHLRRHLWNLEQHPRLADAVRRLVKSKSKVGAELGRLCPFAEEESAQKIAIATRRANRRNAVSVVGAIAALTVAAIAGSGAINAGRQAEQAKKEMAAAQKQKDDLAKNSEKLTANLAVMEGKEKAAQEKAKQAADQYKKAQDRTKSAQVKAAQADQKVQATQQQFAAAQQQVAQANATLTQVNQEKEVATAAKMQAEQAKGQSEEQLAIAQTESKKAVEQVAIAKTELEQAIAQQKIAQADTEKAKIALVEVQDKRETILTVNRLEKQDLGVLNRSKFAQVRGLVDAMRAGEEAQGLKQLKGDEGFAASPTYAIQTILDQVENRALQPWKGSEKSLGDIAPLHQTLLVHEDRVDAAQFSPDG